MSTAIKNGKLLVLLTIALILFVELIAWIFLYRNDRWTRTDITRSITTLALLYYLWDGSRLARWVMVLCLFGGAGYGIHFMVTNPVWQRRPDAGVIFTALVLLMVILGLILVTPWVSAFLRHQREKESAPSPPVA